ncbi:hypothetical protein L1887_34805 [Cichorium endivia]|nr:hypothetical protein L1887_34805 [Cichorium endivia]
MQWRRFVSFPILAVFTLFSFLVCVLTDPGGVASRYYLSVEELWFCKVLNWGLVAAATATEGVDVRVPETGAEEEETTGPALAGTETAWPFWPSTGFLERWRPRLMCLSQTITPLNIQQESEPHFLIISLSLSLSLSEKIKPLNNQNNQKEKQLSLKPILSNRVTCSQSNRYKTIKLSNLIHRSSWGIHIKCKHPRNLEIQEQPSTGCTTNQTRSNPSV